MNTSFRMSVLALCAIALILGPTDNAEAFWKAVGKWSGPGPFWGVDVVYPFNLGPPTLELDLLNDPDNLRLLNQYFFPEPLFTDLDQLLQNEDAMRALGNKFGVEEFEVWTDRKGRLTDDGLRQAFVDALQKAANDGDKAGELTPDDPEDAEAWLLAINEYQLAEFQRGSFTRFRFPGLSKLPGTFTSQRMFRLDGGGRDPGAQQTVDIAKQLVTVSFGYTQSYKNDLPYPDGVGNTTVRWLTLYPAFERRFCPCGESTNWFVNVGPAVHYVYGDAFDAFSKVSARTRVGWSNGHVGVGFEGDYFFGGIEHTRVGSTDDGMHQWGYGFFLHFELPRFSL